MALHLLCLTNGGLPIFTRKKGECENLPFSTVASLNGFHMFFKSLGIQLQTTHAEGDWIYLWQDFHNAFTVIACGRGLGEIVLQKLGELTNAAISLFVSRAELSQPALLDRVKKESKHFLPIVEFALENAITLSPSLTDCVLAVENSALQHKLNDFSSQCGSLFCSLVTSQRLIVATEGWWDLDILDREVLMLLLNSSSSLQNDIPIYLPNKSSSLAYRFVSIPIPNAPNSVLCVICGSVPAYSELHKAMQNIFRNDVLSLMNNVERCIPRCIPENVDIDGTVLAMILLNTETKKCVFSPNMEKQTSSSKRMNTAASSINGNNNQLEILKKFYFRTLEEMKNNPDILDQYWCTENNKCYALSDDNKNIIFVLFGAVQTFTMRFITQDLLSSIVQEKNYCW